MNAREYKAYKIRNHIRQICRTDLLQLCHVLGYKDVCLDVHKPILDALQHFTGGKDVLTSDKSQFEYRPECELWRLEGNRNTLVLYPRGHLKTSITIAHIVQWIINYPDIRVCVSTSTGEQNELVLGSLLKHFRLNEDFRALFPEFCPRAERAMDWGTQHSFTVPCRKDISLKEPTVWTASVGKVNAGFRADVTKHSDLVNEQNVKTPGGIREVNSYFGNFEPIVERYNAEGKNEASRGWNDVEGTRYDFGDLYGVLMKSPDYHVVLGSAIVEGELDDSPCTCKNIKEQHTVLSHCRTLWPNRFPPKELLRILRNPAVGARIFSAQYLNRCVPDEGGLCSPEDIVFVPREHIRNIMPTLRLHATIDLHGMEQSNQSDFTVITLAGFDRDGRMYVIEICRGRFTPEQVINHVFRLHDTFRPIDFKIEKDAHARVLLPFLQREMSKRGKYPTMVPLKRDNHTSKKHRIRSLQPWFKQSIIRFADDIPCRAALMDEIIQFPSESTGVHDDILDTLADQMQNQDGVNYDVIADSPDRHLSQFGQPRPHDRFLGFGEGGVSNWLYPDADRNDKVSITGYN